MYRRTLDRELEPELYLMSKIYFHDGKIPGFGHYNQISQIYDSSKPEILNRLKSSGIKEKLSDAISSRLSEIEQKVVYLRFGFLGGVVHSLKETCQSVPRTEDMHRLGKTYPAGEPRSRENARRIEIRALLKLRRSSQYRELNNCLRLLANELGFQPEELNIPSQKSDTPEVTPTFQPTIWS